MRIGCAGGCALLLALLAPVPVHASGERPVSVAAAEPRTGLAARVKAEGTLALPLRIDQGYPFVAGSVNGRAGHFMLDNGTPFRFFLHSGHAPVTLGAETGRGQAGSGQAIVVHEALGLRSLTLGAHDALEAPAARHGTHDRVKAADFGFIQSGVRPDFLGFIGAAWLPPFAFSLRYDPPRLLLADAASGEGLLVKDSQRVALIRFEGQDGVLPHATLHLADEPIRARFDTGTPGVLQLTPSLRARLEQAGALQCPAPSAAAPAAQAAAAAPAPVAAAPPCRVAGLRYRSAPLDLDPIIITAGDDNRLTLGAALLSRYVSVWNLSRSTLDLRRQARP